MTHSMAVDTQSDVGKKTPEKAATTTQAAHQMAE